MVMSAETEVLVYQVQERDPFLEAEQLVDWLSDYLTASRLEEQPRIPDTLPLLTSRRLQALTGDVPVESQLAVTRAAFQGLTTDSQYNAFLYIAGYPLEAIKALGDVVDDDERYPIQQLFLAANYVMKRSAPPKIVEAHIYMSADRFAKRFGAAALSEDIQLGGLNDFEEEWKLDGLCNQTDPDVFFPEKGEAANAKAAKSICTKCPVRDECLKSALEGDEPFGIWGGTTERERRKLKRQSA